MISYDSEDREYTCDTFTTEELLRDQIGLEANAEVLQDLDAELPDLTWCKKRFGSSDIAFALEMGWAAFVDIVKDDAGARSMDATSEEPTPDEFALHEAFGVSYAPKKAFHLRKFWKLLGALW
jgi:HEPN superfamily RES-like protein